MGFLNASGGHGGNPLATGTWWIPNPPYGTLRPWHYGLNRGFSNNKVFQDTVTITGELREDNVLYN